MGALHFEADIDISKLLAKTAQIDKTLRGLAQQATNSGSMLDRSFQSASKSASLLGNDVNSLQRNLLGLASVATLSRLGQQVVNIRGEFQQLGIAFEVMLGSKDKADQLMKEQIAFAQKTPFTLTDVATNTKQLIAMGIATEKVMGTMKALGDVAAGTSVPIARVAINYGQVATIGKLQGRELRDFAMAGIPLIDELAKNLGKAKGEIAGMVEAGQIGFPDVEKAFQTMTAEGGKFYNLMERQNKSVTGQISNLTDKLQVMANKIGQSNEGLIYAGISGLSTMVDHYEEILKILEALIVTYGIYRAALMLTTAAQNINTISLMASEWLAMGKALGFATANQMLFNSALLANPVVAAIAGITALIAVMLIFSEKAKTAEDHIKDLNDSMDQIGKQLEVETAIQKYEELSDKTDKTKQEQDELNKTIQKLAVIFPGAVTETNKYGQAVGLVTEKLMAQNKELRDSLLLASQKKAQEAQKSLNELLAEQVHLTNQINTGKQVTHVKNPRAGADYDITTVFTKEEIEAKKIQLSELAAKIIEFGGTVDRENSEIMRLKTVEATAILAGYKDLFVDVTKFTKQGAIDAKTQLQKIVTPEGSMAGDMVKQQITALDQYIAKLVTTGEQEKKWRQELETAQNKLAEINKEGYQSLDPAKDKADQEAIIKDLKEKLGLNKKQKQAVDELKAATEELARAVKSGDTAAAAAAAKRITALENEKRKVEELMDAEMKRAWRNQFDGQKMDPLNPIGAKPIVQIGSQKTVKGILYEVTAIDKTGPTWTKVKAQFSALNKFEKDERKKGEKEQEDLEEKNRKKKLEFQENLLNYSRQFTGELINQMNITEEESKLLNGLADSIFNFAKGDMLGAGFAAGSAIISAIFAGSGNTDATTKALEHVNSLLDQQSKILSNLRDNNYLELAAKQFDDLGKSIELSTKKLKENGLHTKKDKEEYLKNPAYNKSDYKQFGQENVKDFGTQDFIDAYTKGIFDFNEAEAGLVESIVTAQKQRTELIQATFNEALGFDASNVSDSIVQGIEDGLKLGENSLGDFAESFGELMKKALTKSIIDSMKTKLTDGFLTNMTEFLKLGSEGGNTLTPGELATLESNFAESVKQGTEAMDAIKPILDKYSPSVSSDSTNSMTGAIKGITEDTASLLAGQMMGIRTDMKINQELSRSQLEILDQGLSVWQGIERNTRGISRLENVENGINELVRLYKQNG